MILSKDLRKIHICVISIPRCRIRDDRQLESVEIIDDRDSKQHDTYPFPSICLELISSKFFSDISNDSFVLGHIILHTVDHISESEKKDPDDYSSKQMYHRENIHDQQKRTQPYSKIDKHLLSSDFLKFDICFGNPCTECCQSENSIYT